MVYHNDFVDLSHGQFVFFTPLMNFTELPSLQFFLCAEDQCLLQSTFVQLTGKDLKRR